MAILDGKTLLITGGTGSFGKAFIKIVLHEHNPKSVRIYSRGEFMQMEVRNHFRDERLRFLIGDVRDKERLHRAMNDVDIVVHAAALKQVPTCEYNPIEAVRTNVDGSVNVVDAAINNAVEKVMLISTDKAVHPVNLYGATKMVAEKLFIQGNSYTGGRKTRFSCVRYGNVVGSRGSVVPLFEKQKKEGLITITDKRMTRFWIAIEDGIRFVIDCVGRMKGGEVFVPKIPSMRVVDLADAIAPDCEKRCTGIRAGEKIHEILLTEEEARHTKDFGAYFLIEPEHPFWKKDNYMEGTPLPDGFRYTSDTNDQWLTREELKNMVAAHEL
ncbi:MAG: UDP-N-acetylglucosamine 4,6-dehydratase (inverting) [Theionarchaea archaeon]|nr:UDP-N-acetylglucosamine 4,6-dehydratase (inverting) [Theionarchaea archaeon]